MSDLNDLARLLRICQSRKDYVTLTLEKLHPTHHTVEYTGQITFVGNGEVYITNGPGAINISEIVTLDQHVPGEDLHPAIKAAINEQRRLEGLPPI